MSFPRYGDYKDSGVEWLGEVPSHWEHKRLRFIVSINPSKAEVAQLSPDTEVSFLPMEAIGEKGELDLSRTRALGEVLNGYSYFADNDLVFAKVTPCFENGKGAVISGLLNRFGFGTTELTVLRPNDTDDRHFIWWLLNSRPFREPGVAEMLGAGGLKRVPDSYVADFRAPWPIRLERATIAAFLDRETAKIDALVAEQEKLIALLKEKRQAVISHAVTKGLDPTAPMKDGGIEWLGEVPVHWSIVRLKRVCVLQRGYDLPMELREDGEVPVVSSGGLLGNHSRAQASGPGVITGRYGTIGEFIYIDSDYWPLNTALFTINIFGNFARFVWYMLQSCAEHFVVFSQKAAVPGVDRNDVHEIFVARPPVDEQIAIVAFLDEELKRIDTLANEGHLAIGLLKERRSALISAAVTGKIDVRGLASAEAA